MKLTPEIESSGIGDAYGCGVTSKLTERRVERSVGISTLKPESLWRRHVVVEIVCSLDQAVGPAGSVALGGKLDLMGDRSVRA